MGKMLKSTNGWESEGNGEDFFGFSALPAGLSLSNGSFEDKGNVAHIWSSTETDIDVHAYHLVLRFNRSDATLSNAWKSAGFSVRCLKD